MREGEADEAPIFQAGARQDLGLLRNDYGIRIGVFAQIRKIMQYPCPGDGAIKIPLAGDAEVVPYVFDQIPMACDVTVSVAGRRASRQIDDVARRVYAADALARHIPQFEIQDLYLPLQGERTGSLSAGISSGGSIVRPTDRNRIFRVVVKAIVVARNRPEDSIVLSQNASSAGA